jgi:hypothetical protein
VSWSNIQVEKEEKQVWQALKQVVQTLKQVHENETHLHGNNMHEQEIFLRLVSSGNFKRKNPRHQVMTAVFVNKDKFKR